MEHFMDYRTIGGQEYYISTVNIFDMSWETKVFESENGKVTNWSEEYQGLYPDYQKAKEGHYHVLHNLKECLANYKDYWDEDEL